MKALVIIDPQNDFINGTLPVGGADQAMDKLAAELSAISVDKIFVTMDCHPTDHMSFSAQGGPWPPHCMKYSEGAAIWPSLFTALAAHPAEVHFIEKGTDSNKEEYSAFEMTFPAELREAEEIYLCGLAGDVCVLNSLRDLANHGLGDKIIVLEDVTPSLDDGSALLEMIGKTGVRVTKIGNI